MARNRDREIIHGRLDALGKWARRRIHVVQFAPQRPAHLPNQLLSWGQQYVKKHNCAIPKEMRYKHHYRRDGMISESINSKLDPYLICKQKKFRNYGKDKPNVGEL